MHEKTCGLSLTAGYYKKSCTTGKAPCDTWEVASNQIFGGPKYMFKIIALHCLLNNWRINVKSGSVQMVLAFVVSTRGAGQSPPVRALLRHAYSAHWCVTQNPFWRICCGVGSSASQLIRERCVNCSGSSAWPFQGNTIYKAVGAPNHLT